MDSENLIIHPKGEDGYVTFSIRVKTEIQDKLNTVAAQTSRSRNEIVGLLLEYALDHCTVVTKASDAITV